MDSSVKGSVAANTLHNLKVTICDVLKKTTYSISFILFFGGSLHGNVGHIFFIILLL